MSALEVDVDRSATIERLRTKVDTGRVLIAELATLLNDATQQHDCVVDHDDWQESPPVCPYTHALNRANHWLVNP